MPVDQELATLIRHVEWIRGMLKNYGGCEVLEAEVKCMSPSHTSAFKYLDPNGDVVEVQLRVFNGR